MLKFAKRLGWTVVFCLTAVPLELFIWTFYPKLHIPGDFKRLLWETVRNKWREQHGT